MAGGLLPTAALRHIEVQRLVAHDKQTMLSLDIPDPESAEVTKKLDSFEIHDGDRIRVFPIASGNEDAVYLEGHVIRPGRYSYHADMRVTDLVSSYKDLLPEPATKYAEVVRLNRRFSSECGKLQSCRRSCQSFTGALLKPMDTVRIFSSFDFENPPSVSVSGRRARSGYLSNLGEIHLATPFTWPEGSRPTPKQPMPRYSVICRTGNPRYSV